MCAYMAKYAEEIFEPKRVLTAGDWLQTNKEPHQTFAFYKQGRGNIKWFSPTFNTIYLAVADRTFTEHQLDSFKKYVSAFFLGVRSVEIMMSGEMVPGTNRKQQTFPADFLENQVNNRVGWMEQKQF